MLMVGGTNDGGIYWVQASRKVNLLSALRKMAEYRVIRQAWYAYSFPLYRSRTVAASEYGVCGETVQRSVAVWPLSRAVRGSRSTCNMLL